VLLLLLLLPGIAPRVMKKKTHRRRCRPMVSISSISRSSLKGGGDIDLS
jgi:hypothetical protein